MTATSERQVSGEELSFAVSGVASLSPADFEAVLLLFENPAKPVVSLDSLAQRFERLLCLSHETLHFEQVVRPWRI